MKKTVKSRQGNEDIQKNRSHPGQNNKAKAETGTGSFWPKIRNQDRCAGAAGTISQEVKTRQRQGRDNATAQTEDEESRPRGRRG